MNPNDILRIVDSLHREKSIPEELVFQAIEQALVSACKRQYGEMVEIVVGIERETGVIRASCDERELDPDEIAGRIGAQTAKQVIIQKIREAERDARVDEYQAQLGDMISGVVQRSDEGVTTVSIGSIEAILPRSERIPGESHHPNERVRAIIHEVKTQGSRVKVVLSRTRPQLIKRLFEQEIPEIAEGVISINAMSREPGYRSKVAVSSTDQRIDCVGACVGVRGNRIKNIVDELAGERIDIVRWNEDPEALIPNALQPAEVEQVLLCDMIGRAIVLVREDQLSLAIGRRGQNVRLASKLCGWDIEIMTGDELEQQIERAVMGFSALDGVNEELAQSLVEQGYLSYDDLEVIEPDALMEMGSLTAEQTDHIVGQAEAKAMEAEHAAAEVRRVQTTGSKASSATGQAAGGSPEAAKPTPDGPAPDSSEQPGSAETEQAGTETLDAPAEEVDAPADEVDAPAEEKVEDKPAEAPPAVLEEGSDDSAEEVVEANEQKE